MDKTKEKQERHPIIDEIMKVQDGIGEYESKVEYHLKDFIGKKVDDVLIKDIQAKIKTDVLAALKERYPSKDDRQLIGLYMLPDHQLERLLKAHEAFTPAALEQIVTQLSGIVARRETEHHPTEIANLFYEDPEKAKGVMRELYTNALGAEHAKGQEATLDQIKSADRMMEHYQRSYEGEIHPAMRRARTTTKPGYQGKDKK